MASLNDFVSVAIAITGAVTLTTPAFGVPLVLGYHTHWSDRTRTYTSLAAMVTDGFSVSEPTYKAAQAIFAQARPPSQVVVGRRALPPLQSFTVTCTDGTVGDGYKATIIGSDGKSHALAYTNVANPGSAVTGTVSVTNNSASITFSVAQTMSAGDLLTFSSQPGVYYALASAVSSSTSGTLTTLYQGTTTAAATSTRLAALAGTFSVTQGSATVTTTTSQVGVIAVGDSVQFVSQLGTYYPVFAVSASTLTLGTPYTGTTAASTQGADVCKATTAAASLQTQIAGFTNVGTASVTGAVITVSRTDGALTDFLGWTSNIQLAVTTADPGIAADIAAVLAVNQSGWYGLVLDSNSPAEVIAAAAAIEATGQGGKFFFADNADTLATSSSVTTDVFSQLQTHSYRKTFAVWSGSQMLNYIGAACAGFFLPQQAGSYAAMYKTLAAVPADTDATITETQRLALNTMSTSQPGPGGKDGNYYANSGGANFLWPGTTPSGQFMDVTIFVDWLQVTMQIDVVTALASVPKVPYTDFGIGQIADAIGNRLAIGVKVGGIDPARPGTVTRPTAASIPQASRAARDLPGMGFTGAGLAGAIGTVEISGSLSP